MGVPGYQFIAWMENVMLKWSRKRKISLLPFTGVAFLWCLHEKLLSIKQRFVKSDGKKQLQQSGLTHMDSVLTWMTYQLLTYNSLHFPAFHCICSDFILFRNYPSWSIENGQSKTCSRFLVWPLLSSIFWIWISLLIVDSFVFLHVQSCISFASVFCCFQIYFVSLLSLVLSLYFHLSRPFISALHCCPMSQLYQIYFLHVL